MIFWVLKMAEIKIECEFDFALLVERELRESKQVPGPKAAKALEKFARYCFQLGFKAGQLPENRPINLSKVGLSDT